MVYKRFLRDGVFERLFSEVKDMYDRINQDEDIPEYVEYYIHSVIISYKTCKISLERIEEAIECAKPTDKTGEICIPLCDAANHIKSGILSLHETLWRNLESYRGEMHVEFSEFETLLQENYLGS